MINMFFECSPDRYDNYHMELWPNNDTLPLDYLNNCFEIYRDGSKVICIYRPDKLTIVELQSQTGCADPLSLEAVDLLGITGSYIGRTYEDVFLKYPELEGTRIVATEDGDIEVDIVRKISVES